MSYARGAVQLGDVRDALVALLEAPGRLGTFVREIFGSFEFAGVTPQYPTATFDGRATLDVGGVAVELIELGPAHTDGDVMDYLAFVEKEAGGRHAAGMGLDAAVADIDLGRFASLGERSRLAVNVAAVYRELVPTVQVGLLDLFVGLAELEAVEG